MHITLSTITTHAYHPLHYHHPCISPSPLSPPMHITLSTITIHAYHLLHYHHPRISPSPLSPPTHITLSTITTHAHTPSSLHIFITHVCFSNLFPLQIFNIKSCMPFYGLVKRHQICLLVWRDGDSLFKWRHKSGTMYRRFGRSCFLLI